MKQKIILMNALSIFIDLAIINFFFRLLILNKSGFVAAGLSFFELIIWSVVGGVIVYYFMHKQLKPFFIARLILRKPAFEKVNVNNSQAGGSSAPSRPGQSPIVSSKPTMPVISSASANGLITWFEPRELNKVNYVGGVNVFGYPGKGLQSANGMSARNASLGQNGELNFGKALEKSGLKDKFAILWSVRMPDTQAMVPSTKFNTDIDCIIVTGDRVYLVDLKNYASGDVTYESHGDELYTIDNVTGNLVGKPKKMSRNMAMASDIFKKHFPGVRFETVVVLMPTDKGAGVVGNVQWPGSVTCVSLVDFLSSLKYDKAYDGSPTFARVVNSTKSLVS